MPLTSFYTALTGLNTNSAAINVIGDNLANMNTTAFKSGKANFAELLGGLAGTSSTGNPISLGLGSTINGINRNNTQGVITTTGETTDAAINGNGFFLVATEGGMGFTRCGNFQINREGNLISSDGFQLMGYPAIDGVIDSSSLPVPITVRKGQVIPARATSSLGFISGNIDSQVEDGGSVRNAVQIYDSLGTAHELTLRYTKVGTVRDPVTNVTTTTWNWSAELPAEVLGGAAGDPPVSVGSGSLDFVNGNMTAPATNPVLNITGLASGAIDMQISLNLYDAEGVAVITCSAQPTDFKPTQDGYASTILTDISINEAGVIVGSSLDGRSAPLAQLALADFPNVEGLQKYRGSTFIAFPSSGEPSIGVAGTGGRGRIVGSSLEQSNVDMAQEFINLIVAQRAYQANSRVITTTDELYQESINLKR
ncbi:MAG: flagellar hook protein FlgE [Acidobacteria bacterium]|nr:flagellar hook protein FlgE [Acidobacteriota bacterium]